MNDSSPAPTSHGADADLAKQVRSLQSLVVTVLALSLVSGIALMAFLYGQSRIVSRNLADAKMFVDDYNTNTVPRLKALQQSLEVYAASHPDLVPTLQKFGMAGKPGGAPGTAPGGAPAPGTAPRR